MPEPTIMSTAITNPDRKFILSAFIDTAKRAYRSLYDAICGRHPRVYPWHFQWLSSRAIVSSLRDASGYLSAGKILDVGCGTSPYRDLLPAGSSYTGIDIPTGEGKPDIVIAPDKPWPLENAAYDSVICTQVLEHAENKDLLLAEIRRVLRPGGTLLLSVPFIYSEHGMPWDYRRFSVNGVSGLLGGEYEAVHVVRSCKAGTTLTTLFLNWVDESMSVRRWLRCLKPLLLPFWLLLSFSANMIGLLIDLADGTNSLYLDAVFVGRRKG